MSNTPGRRRGLLLVSALSFASMVPMSASALVIGVDMDPATAGIQSTLTIDVGDPFSVDVVIEDATTPITSFGFTLNFDPAVLTATGVASGGFLATATGGAPFVLPATSAITSDTVEFAEFAINLAPIPTIPFGATGDGVLAQITFDAVAAGASSLSLSDLVIVGSVFDATLPGFGPGELTPDTVGSGEATVRTGTGQAPAPGVILLVAVGLLGLGTFTRPSRRRTRTSIGRSVFVTRTSAA